MDHYQISRVNERKPLWVPWVGWACARARVTVKRMSLGLSYLILPTRLILADRFGTGETLVEETKKLSRQGVQATSTFKPLCPPLKRSSTRNPCGNGNPSAARPSRPSSRLQRCPLATRWTASQRKTWDVRTHGGGAPRRRSAPCGAQRLEERMPLWLPMEWKCYGSGTEDVDGTVAQRLRAHHSMERVKRATACKPARRRPRFRETPVHKWRRHEPRR